MKKIIFVIISVIILTGCDFLFPNGGEEVFVAQVFPDSGVIVTPMKVIVQNGENAVFTYTLKEGYVLNSITAGGVSITPSSNTSFTLTNIGSDTKVYVITKEKEEFFAVNVTADSGIIVTPMKVIVQNGGNADFSYILKKGYELISITVDGVLIIPSNNSFTLTNIDSDTKVYITTKAITFMITTNAGIGGIVNPSGNIIVNEGQDQTFGIVSNPGFLQDILKVNGVIKPSTSSYTFSNISSDGSLYATFKKDSLLWPLLYIEWEQDSTYIEEYKWDEIDPVTLNYFSNGTFTRLRKGVLNSPENYTLDQSKHPATITYGGVPCKIAINSQRYVISYNINVNGSEQCVQLIFKNNKYKQL